MFFFPLQITASKKFSVNFENTVSANNPNGIRNSFIKVVVFGFEPRLFTIKRLNNY